MGLIKNIFKVLNVIKEEKNKENLFLQMNIDELKELDDELLFEAIYCRMIHEEKDMDVEECLNTFTDAKYVFYIVNYFDMEVQNGGLCQFFVNSSRLVAPYLLNCLNSINAIDYKELLEEFVSSNDISLSNLDSFIIDDIDDYEKQCERYDFDNFDNKYYELYESKPLDKYLLNYCKKHIDDFC